MENIICTYIIDMCTKWCTEEKSFFSTSNKADLCQQLQLCNNPFESDYVLNCKGKTMRNSLLSFLDSSTFLAIHAFLSPAVQLALPKYHLDPCQLVAITNTHIQFLSFNTIEVLYHVITKECASFISQCLSQFLLHIINYN